MISEDLWNTLLGLDVADVERRSLSKYNPEKRSYRLRILDREYDISPTNKSIRLIVPRSDQPLDFHLQLAAVNYLIGAKDCPLAGKWVSETQFPSGPLFFRGHHRMPTRKLEKIFGQNPDAFASLSLSLGGQKVDGGDRAFEFYFFPRLPLRLILWLADDEFPARMIFLFDQSAGRHFRLDGLWVVGQALANRFLSSVPEASEKNNSR